MRRLPFLWLFLLLALPATAEDTPVVAPVATATATTAVNGDTLLLQDGRRLHLAGILAPAIGTDLGAAAKSRLQELAAGQTLTLNGAAADRYGRVTAEVTAGRTWLQGAMLQEGLAFVYPPQGDEAQLDEMRTAEASARAARRGIWAEPAYADLTPEQAKRHQGAFAFVVGPVVDAVKLKDRVYLNFSADWHHDFTAVIAAHDLRNFRKAGLDPLALKGKTVRLRGWVGRDFRPLMTLTGPAQIEILDR